MKFLYLVFCVNFWVCCVILILLVFIGGELVIFGGLVFKYLEGIGGLVDLSGSEDLLLVFFFCFEFELVGIVVLVYWVD